MSRVPATCPVGFTGRYTVVSGDTMFLIAQRFGVSLNALIAANPHITNPNLIFPGDVLCVPGPVAPSPTRVPVSCPPGFQGRYTVVRGDTMFLIAQRFGVSLNALIAANPQITNPNLIFPGDVLCVPGVVSPTRVPVTCPPGFQGRYTVQPGDTMFLIAQRFGVSLAALIAANPQISDPNLIFPGDVLCVPGHAPISPTRVPVHCPPGFECRYTVQPGDTMFLIAQRFGVSLAALIAANPHITDPNLIFPGDVLCVPCPPPKFQLPCCVVLCPKVHVPKGTTGVALAHIDFCGSEAVSVLAKLPDPSFFGDFDIYIATVVFPKIGGFGNVLHPVKDVANLFATTITLPPHVHLGPDAKVIVEPFKTKHGKTGPVVLEGSLMNCHPGC